MKRTVANSKKLLARAEQVIPRGAQTLSKAPDQFVRGVSPYAIERAEGCRVWDVDGNKYLDLTSSLGAIILGHRHPVVERAVQAQRERGVIFGLPGDLEVVLAERLQKILPHAEMVRFGLNGSDVTTAAIRVARAYTGRDHIAKCGYHGWPDWTIATHALRSRGVPQAVKNLTHEFQYNDLQSLEQIFADQPNQVAAVILEPMAGTLPTAGFLEAVRVLTHQHGAVLIFDELVTGFRLAPGGAAEYFNIQPDLACYGKAISNGEPLSVLAGRGKIMQVLEDVFFSFTYAGYLPSLAAALATLDVMSMEPVHKQLWQQGQRLIEGYNDLADKYAVPTQASGVGPHPLFTFKNGRGEDDLGLKSLFIQETAKAGLLTNCSVLINYAHTAEVIGEVLSRLRPIFQCMGQAVGEGKVEASLEGPMIKPRAIRSL